MTAIHFTEVTTSTPEQFVAGLRDFGPGRSKLFDETVQAIEARNVATNRAEV